MPIPTKLCTRCQKNKTIYEVCAKCKQKEMYKSVYPDTGRGIVYIAKRK